MKKVVSMFAVLFVLGVLSVSCRGKKESCPAYGKALVKKTHRA